MNGYETILTLGFGSLAVISVIAFALLLFVRFKKRQSEHAIEKQRLQFEFNETLLKAQLEIREQTLSHISQEIHDNIGQVLTLAKLTVNTIDINHHADFQEKKQSSIGMLTKAIQDLRHLSKGLNTSYITDLGFLKSIQAELDFLKRAGVFITTFKVANAPYKFEQQHELILFRIFQEVLNNTIKHSKAREIVVAVSYLPECFSIEICDDGTGFDMELLDENKHQLGIGFRSMQSRAKMINATLSIDSIIGQGTRVQIKLPIFTTT